MVSSTGYRDRARDSPPIPHPDSMSTKDLFNLSLSALSKSLPQSTSSRATLDIYLRWLQEHRQHPSSRTQSWENTLLHWTQSLHTRGFDKSDIIDAVEDWKDANHRYANEGRAQISKRDVRKAFDQLKRDTKDPSEQCGTRDRDIADRSEPVDGDSWRRSHDIYRPSDSIRPVQGSPSGFARKDIKQKLQESFEKPPPAGYVCNRCGKKGHHLQVCPTNLDPAYDRPPPSDYRCEICRVKGEHFKSLCPKNEDPFSIIMKRKKENIKTSPPNKDRKNHDFQAEDKEEAERLERRERRNQEGRLTKVSSSSSSPSSSSRDEKLAKLQEIDDLKERIFNGDEIDLQELLKDVQFGLGQKRRLESGTSSGGASPARSIIEERLKRTRLATESSNETPSSPKERETNSTSITRSGNNLDEKKDMDIMMDDQFESNNSFARIKERNMTRFKSSSLPIRSHKINPDAMSIDESDEQSDEAEYIEPAKPPKEYCENVRRLMQRNPEMQELVNPAYRRPKASEMWKRVEQNQNEEQKDEAHKNLPGLNGGSSPSSSSHYHSAESTPMLRSPELKKQIRFAQFDGACDEDERPSKRTKTGGISRAKNANTTNESSSGNLPQGRPKFPVNPNPTSHPVFARDDPNSPYFPQTVPRNAPDAFKAIATGQGDANEDTQMGGMTGTSDKQTEKLNDLRKFSDSFKLTTPVPEDLVPLMTNSPEKRKKIFEKNRHNAEEISDSKSYGQANGATENGGAYEDIQMTDTNDKQTKLTTPPSDMLHLKTSNPERQKELQQENRRQAEKPSRSWCQFDGACDDKEYVYEESALSSSQFDGACDNQRYYNDQKFGPRTSSKMGDSRATQRDSKGDEVISLSAFLREEALVEENEPSPPKDDTAQVKPSLLRRLTSFRKPKGRAPPRLGKTSVQEGEEMSTLTKGKKSNGNLTEENLKGLAANPDRGPSRSSEQSFGSLDVNLPGSRPRKPKPLNEFAPYIGRQSLESTQFHDTGSETTLQEGFDGISRKTSISSDATALPIHARMSLQEARGDIRKDMRSNTNAPSQNKPKNEGNENDWL